MDALNPAWSLSTVSTCSVFENYYGFAMWGGDENAPNYQFSTENGSQISERADLAVQHRGGVKVVDLDIVCGVRRPWADAP
ncbi:MAG: hypothetical protein AAF224_06050 [Pseudomonadota bacterium]